VRGKWSIFGTKRQKKQHAAIFKKTEKSLEEWESLVAISNARVENGLLSELKKVDCAPQR